MHVLLGCHSCPVGPGWVQVLDLDTVDFRLGLHLPLACEGCQIHPQSCYVRAIVSVAGGPAVVFEASVELLSVVFLGPSLTTVAVAVMTRIDRGTLLRTLVMFGAASNNCAYEQRQPIKCSHGGFAPQRDGHTVLSR